MNFVIRPKIYPFPLQVFIEPSKKEVKKQLKRWGEGKKFRRKLHTNNCDGLFIMNDSNVGFLVMKRKPKTAWDYSCIQHEILHYVIEVMRRVGMPLSEESEEAYTYLQGYITKKFFRKNIIPDVL